MRLSFHLGANQLTLLSLSLLCPLPRTVTSYPHPPAALPPAEDAPELDSALLHLRAALDDPRDDRLVRPDPRAERPPEPGDEEDGPWEEEVLPRAQRRDLMARPLSPFPRSHLLEGLYYQDGGKGEDGGKRNEALTSIAGELQAVSREKGGFGFRFGRKRWTDRGRMKGAQRRTSDEGVSMGSKEFDGR